MPVVYTHELRQGQVIAQNEQVYCGLDTMVTLEVFEALQTLFNETPPAYNYERAMQGPLLEVMLRGFLVDETERQGSIKKLRVKLDRLDSILQQYAHAVWGKTLNPRSHPQLKAFFYGAMQLPEQWISDKGKRKLSFRREVLEKLEVYFHAMPIIAAILGYRDVAKQLEFLETEVDPDGRMRTSYNIAGTETWRLSSSASSLGTGGNLQNWQPELRRVFVADPGYKLCVIDLEQAESREVGWLIGTLFDDWTYLEACEAGDLHTTTAKLIWKDLGWTGKPKEDRAIADRNFYRAFSYRDMSKRGGHGVSYYGTPWTMARHLKVPVKMMQDFQDSFFLAYPGIPRWHKYIAREIQTKQSLTTAFGLTRHFFGRPNDDATLREAIAFSPQSSTAIRTNLGLYRIWERMRTVQLLAQTHDSVTFQYKAEAEATVIPQALKLMETALEHKGRKFTVPGEAKIGWNWSYYCCGDKTSAKCQNCKLPVNPNGLMKYKGTDARQRQTGLDRVL